MGDRPAAERACKDPNPIIDGRKANVNLAILGAKPRGNLQASKFYIPFLSQSYSFKPTNLIADRNTIVIIKYREFLSGVYNLGCKTTYHKIVPCS